MAQAGQRLLARTAQVSNKGLQVKWGFSTIVGMCTQNTVRDVCSMDSTRGRLYPVREARIRSTRRGHSLRFGSSRLRKCTRPPASPEIILLSLPKAQHDAAPSQVK